MNIRLPVLLLLGVALLAERSRGEVRCVRSEQCPESVYCVYYRLSGLLVVLYYNITCGKLSVFFHSRRTVEVPFAEE